MEAKMYAGVGQCASAREPTPFDRMAAAEKSVLQLCDRLAELADKLVGPVPPSTGGETAQSTSCGGVLGTCEASASEIIRRTNLALATVIRIERMLP